MPTSKTKRTTKKAVPASKTKKTVKKTTTKTPVRKIVEKKPAIKQVAKKRPAPAVKRVKPLQKKTIVVNTRPTTKRKPIVRTKTTTSSRVKPISQEIKNLCKNGRCHPDLSQSQVSLGLWTGTIAIILVLGLMVTFFFALTAGKKAEKAQAVIESCDCAQPEILKKDTSSTQTQTATAKVTVVDDKELETVKYQLNETFGTEEIVEASFAIEVPKTWIIKETPKTATAKEIELVEMTSKDKGAEINFPVELVAVAGYTKQKTTETITIGTKKYKQERYEGKKGETIIIVPDFFKNDQGVLEIRFTKETEKEVMTALKTLK